MFFNKDTNELIIRLIITDITHFLCYFYTNISNLVLWERKIMQLTTLLLGLYGIGLIISVVVKHFRTNDISYDMLICGITLVMLCVWSSTHDAALVQIILGSIAGAMIGLYVAEIMVANASRVLDTTFKGATRTSEMQPHENQ